MIVNIIRVSEIMFGELHYGDYGAKNPHWRRRRRKKRRERRGGKRGAVGEGGMRRRSREKKGGGEETERFSMVTKV